MAYSFTLVTWWDSDGGTAGLSEAFHAGAPVVFDGTLCSVIGLDEAHPPDHAATVDFTFLRESGTPAPGTPRFVYNDGFIRSCGYVPRPAAPMSRQHRAALRARFASR